jgi:hypothetical protein
MSLTATATDLDVPTGACAHGAAHRLHGMGLTADDMLIVMNTAVKLPTLTRLRCVRHVASASLRDSGTDSDPMDSYVSLNDNDLGPAGARALAARLSGCRHLQVLWYHAPCPCCPQAPSH